MPFQPVIYLVGCAGDFDVVAGIPASTGLFAHCSITPPWSDF
jgi:hypothetical protein